MEGGGWSNNNKKHLISTGNVCFCRLVNVQWWDWILAGATHFLLDLSLLVKVNEDSKRPNVDNKNWTFTTWYQSTVFKWQTCFVQKALQEKRIRQLWSCLFILFLFAFQLSLYFLKVNIYSGTYKHTHTPPSTNTVKKENKNTDMKY